VYQLLTDQPLERLQTIYEALPQEVRSALDSPIAKALNSRPSSLVRRNVAYKVRGLRAFLVKQRDDALAQDIVRSYLLGPRKDMVTAFLEATGVAHEDGQVEDEEAVPEGAKVSAAIEGLMADYDKDDVALYLTVATAQWPDVTELAEAQEKLSASAES
jgi:hypothetical protein